MMTRHRKYQTGTIIKSHGIKGELVVMTEQPELFTPGSPVIVEIEGLDVPLFIATVRPRSAGSLLVTFDDIADERDSSELAGLTTYSYTSTAGPDCDCEEDTMTADQLIGFTLFDNSTAIGRIEGIREITTDNWLFEIEGGFLIPIADDLIEEIDTDKNTITMNLPQGLLDL